MTSQFFDGAELGTTQMLSSFGGTEVIATTEQKRSGLYSYRLKEFFGQSWIRVDFPASSEEFFRVAVFFTVAGDTNQIIQIRNSTTALISIGMSGSSFYVKVGSTAVAYGTAPYKTNDWNLLEIRTKISDSGGVVQVKIDGILDIEYVGDTKPGAQTTIDNLYVINPAGGYVYVDDIAINDTNGDYDNSWRGDGHVLYLPTNAAGDQAGLTPSAGLNYQCVDEVPNNGDTDYVDGTTLDTYDLYHAAASGLTSDSVVTHVRSVVVAKDTVANGGKIAIGLKTGGIEYWGGDIVLTTAYTAEEGTDYTLNPKTGLAWTIADIDGIQPGAKTRGS